MFPSETGSGAGPEVVTPERPGARAIDPATAEALRRFLNLARPRFPIAGAILFGSRARGTQRADSDADLAVLLQGRHERLLPTALAMADIAYDVLLETGVNISPLPIWMDQWDRPETFSNPALLREIAAEGLRL
jgi:predicted nucleotidyltransferase